MATALIASTLLTGAFPVAGAGFPPGAAVFGGTLAGAAFGAALAATFCAGFLGGGALALVFAAFAAAAAAAVFDAITVLCATLKERRIAKKGSASATRTNQGRKSGQGSLSPD
jgi:hypothetical protein